MNKTALVCGSLAIDIIMQYEGRFGDTLLADQLHKVNVSFLVPTMRTEFGGCSGNIAYSLKMLGRRHRDGPVHRQAYPRNPRMDRA